MATVKALSWLPAVVRLTHCWVSLGLAFADNAAPASSTAKAVFMQYALIAFTSLVMTYDPNDRLSFIGVYRGITDYATQLTVILRRRVKPKPAKPTPRRAKVAGSGMVGVGP